MQGPFAVPASELDKVLRIEIRVNGELRQEATTEDLIFFDHLLNQDDVGRPNPDARRCSGDWHCKCLFPKRSLLLQFHEQTLLTMCSASECRLRTNSSCLPWPWGRDFHQCHRIRDLDESNRRVRYLQSYIGTVTSQQYRNSHT